MIITVFSKDCGDGCGLLCGLTVPLTNIPVSDVDSSCGFKFLGSVLSQNVKWGFNAILKKVHQKMHFQWQVRKYVYHKAFYTSVTESIPAHPSQFGLEPPQNRTNTYYNTADLLIIPFLSCTRE